MKPSSFQSKTIRQKPDKIKKNEFKRAQRRAAAQNGTLASANTPTPTRAIPALELFQKEDCPFSHAVRSHLSELGLDFIAHSVPDDNAAKHKHLVEAGGKDQVPFFIDHNTGVKLYESRAIIAYLEKEYGLSREASRVKRIAKSFDRNLRREQDQIAWAFKKPVERARRLGNELRDTASTLTDSARVIKEVFKKMIA